MSAATAETSVTAWCDSDAWSADGSSEGGCSGVSIGPDGVGAARGGFNGDMTAAATAMIATRASHRHRSHLRHDGQHRFTAPLHAWRRDLLLLQSGVQGEV